MYNSCKAQAQHIEGLTRLHLPSLTTPPPPNTHPVTTLGPFFIADAAAKASPAVVNITVPTAASLGHNSNGSGFIFDEKGSILTNAHVIADALPPGRMHGTEGVRALRVALEDGRVFQGQVTGFDRVSDLALISIATDRPLPAVQLGSSKQLRVGEWVLALGSPLHLSNTVTAGIVSCVDRKAVELGLAGACPEYIQTDCAINSGNSGGPLVNICGEVVGLACFKAVCANGVSFAIPIDTAKEVVAQLQQHGRVIRPYIGVKMLQLNAYNVAQIRQQDPSFPDLPRGIWVPHVTPGSPADRGGLQKGDIITGFADITDITTANLIKALRQHIGKDMAVRILRDGQQLTLHVTATEAAG
jgi:HtrA serine peptidase 2